jgi:hypothetical protein
MLLSKRARIETVPELVAESAPGCQLSHEAAIGPVAEDAVEYLMTRGLTRDDAVSVLTPGFIDLKLPVPADGGPPGSLRSRRLRMNSQQPAGVRIFSQSLRMIVRATSA